VQHFSKEDRVNHIPKNLFAFALMTGWLLVTTAGPSAAVPIGYCGDGVIQAPEECDDGGTASSDGCGPDCKLEFCGDGIIQLPEQCDDGGTAIGDGCGSDCQFETNGDTDGVDASIEDAGPGCGLDGLANGDGNGDGVLDSTQAKVATLPAANGNGYLTLVSECDLAEVEAVTPESRGGDPGRTYPFGLLGFVLPGCESSLMKVYYHAATSIPSGSEYRKHGPETPGFPATTKFYTLPGVVFGSEAPGACASAVATATFRLFDNQLGDDTGDDGDIVDQGGPGFGGARQAPAASPLGMVSILLALALVGAAGISRIVSGKR